MKFRLGQMTGTPEGAEAASTAGCYFSLDDTREGLTGLAAVYYADSKGRRIRIWPGEGLFRIRALQLALDPAHGDLLNRYALSSEDFTCGNAFLKTSVGSRSFSRSAAKAQIQWEPNANTLRFLRHNGPFADALMRGDYLTLEVGMDAWRHDINPPDRFESLTEVASFNPVTTCDVTVYGGWNPQADGGNGAAAVVRTDGSVIASAEGSRYTKKKKGFMGVGKKSSVIYDYKSASLRGVDFPAAVFMAGPHGARSASITYPSQCNSFTAKIISIEIEQ